jgi:SAM-dependent methyltransferase
MPSPRRWRDALRIPRAVTAYEPMVAALREHLRAGHNVEVELERDDGFSYPLQSADYFELDGTLATIDQRAIAEARGRVLDAGAAAGRYTLALQERGLAVVALDIAPGCVKLMRDRGVVQAHCGDIFALATLGLGRFDTILFGMQGIGIAGSRFGLERLLLSLRPHLQPGAQVLIDSSSPLDDEAWPGGVVEVIARLRYRNLHGEPFPWLYVSEATLREVASLLGYAFDVLERRGGGAREYLARLLPEGSPEGN